MSTNLIPFSDLEKMARAIAVSGLFGYSKPEQALALMLIAQAEGSHPIIAARDYHIINGRPALKADAMLARFQKAGGKVQWLELSDSKVSAKFSHPQSGEVTISWTLEDAQRAQLNRKENWAKYPRQMLKARVISEGVRTCYPDCTVGIYTEEEVGDFEKDPKDHSAIVTEGKIVEAPKHDGQPRQLKGLEQPKEENGGTPRGTNKPPTSVQIQIKEIAPKAEEGFRIPGKGTFGGQLIDELSDIQLKQLCQELSSLDPQRRSHPSVLETLQFIELEFAKRSERVTQ